MVGAIIGKGGAKINEIRQLSGSVIKINEPQDNSNERLVTITGTSECNQMALYMLYSRLGKYHQHMVLDPRLIFLQKVRSIGSRLIFIHIHIAILAGLLLGRYWSQQAIFGML